MSTSDPSQSQSSPPPQPHTSPDPIAVTTLSCLCTRITLPATQAKYATLPIPCELCHCDTCRHQTGSLAAMLFELSSAVPPSLLEKCTAYHTSARVTRYFCRVCGSNLFLKGYSDAGEESNTWLASAGAILRSDGDVGGLDSARVAIQVFVGDPVDGGLFARIVERMRRQGGLAGLRKEDRGVGLLRNVFFGTWTGEKMMVGEVEDFVDRVNKAKARKEEKEENEQGGGNGHGAQSGSGKKLLARCHCGGVQFCITRPDLGRDYGEEVDVYLLREKTRYVARFCTCWSCRAATGLPVHPWAYVPPENIVTVDGQAIEFGSMQGLSQLSGIVKYENEHSGGEVIRSFCGTCGATIFYEHRERPWVVDISVGILRSERGAMAEDFLEWDFKWVSYQEECQTKELLAAIAET